MVDSRTGLQGMTGTDRSVGRRASCRRFQSAHPHQVVGRRGDQELPVHPRCHLPPCRPPASLPCRNVARRTYRPPGVDPGTYPRIRRSSPPIGFRSSMTGGTTGCRRHDPAPERCRRRSGSTGTIGAPGGTLTQRSPPAPRKRARETLARSPVATSSRARLAHQARCSRPLKSSQYNEKTGVNPPSAHGVRARLRLGGGGGSLARTRLARR